MDLSSKQETDLTLLQNDIAALKHDVSSLIEHLKVGVAHGARSAASHVDDRSRWLYRNVATEGERAIRIVGEQVEKQPLITLLLAIGLGFVGGRLLAR